MRERTSLAFTPIVSEIFISYAREDVGFAQRLALALEARGWSVFWDRRIPAGKRFSDVISNELHAAKRVVVLWSASATASDWVLDEAEEARQRGILTPALIERIEPPIGFRRIHAADLVGWSGETGHAGYQRLIEDLTHDLGASRAAGEAAKSPPAPASTPAPSAATDRDARATASRARPGEDAAPVQPKTRSAETHRVRLRLGKRSIVALIGIVSAGVLSLIIERRNGTTDSPLPVETTARPANGSPSEPARRTSSLPSAPARSDEQRPAERQADDSPTAAEAITHPSVRRSLDATLAALPNAGQRQRNSRWRSEAGSDLRSRMDRVETVVRNTFVQMDRTARSEGFREDFKAFPEFLEVMAPPSATLNLHGLSGRWMCRQLNASSSGMLAYTYFNCVVKDEGRCLRLTKTTGSQRFDGCIHAIDNTHGSFIGVWSTNYDRGAPGTYGGFLTQTNRDRLRIIVPGDRSFGVIDLKQP